MTVIDTTNRSHTLIGFANPFLICSKCRIPIKYWHDPDRCECTKKMYNAPCGHDVEVISMCPTWSPVDGCSCTEPHVK